MGKLIVRWNYDRWEVVRKYGYRENLISFWKTKQEAEDDAAFRAYLERADLEMTEGCL